MRMNTPATNPHLREEMMLGFFGLELYNLKDYMEKVSASWNGKDISAIEDRTSVANEIVQKLTELDKLLDEFVGA